MTDPRDALFSELHRTWLKPAGFRKKGRRSERQAEDGLLVSVVLESGPSSPFGPIYFGIDLSVTHTSLPRNRRLMCIGLSSYVEGKQRWIIPYGAATTDLFDRIRALFSTTGVELLRRMSTLPSLTDLFAELDSFWYYESHARCLDWLERYAEATRVIEHAIDNAPHENFRERALRLLAQRQARSDA